MAALTREHERSANVNPDYVSPVKYCITNQLCNAGSFNVQYEGKSRAAHDIFCCSDLQVFRYYST